MASLRILIPIIWVSLFLVQCTTAPEQISRDFQPDTVVERDTNPDLNSSSGENADSESVYIMPGDDQMKTFALLAMQGGVRPVLDRHGLPVASVWAEEERKYCVVLSVSALENPGYIELSDMSRLYGTDSEADFILTCFQWYRGDMFFAYTVKLGAFPVIENYRQENFGPGSESKEAPIAVVADFSTGDGGVSFTVFCGVLKGNVLKIRRNSGSLAVRKDLDRDGIDDVLLYESVYEEGTGKETFITWYRWDTRGLSVYKTVNIVRNLNEFLAAAASSLEKSSFAEFLAKFVLLPETGKVPLNTDFAGSFGLFFHPEEPGDARISSEMAGLTKEEFQSLHRVVFPEILENPFDIAGGDFSIDLPVHLIGDRDHRFTVRLVMDENPFSPRQYYFLARQP